MSRDSIKKKYHKRPPASGPQLEREEARASLANAGGNRLFEVSFDRALCTAGRVEQQAPRGKQYSQEGQTFIDVVIGKQPSVAANAVLKQRSRE